MSVILGINAFHADSAACLLTDGVLVGAVAEERLGERIKHDSAFPVQAIRHLLSEAGISLREVTHIAIARDQRANISSKIRWSILNPVRAIGAVVAHRRRGVVTSNTLENLPEALGVSREECSYSVVPVEHHLAHIASSWFTSPWEGRAAGFSFDASGDFASMMAARCVDSRIEVVDRVCLPHSLGLFYTAACQFIGFDRFGEEYKVMGLNAYGQDAYRDVMREIVAMDPNGWFSVSPGWLEMHKGGESGAMDDAAHIQMGRLWTERWRQRLGDPRRRDDPVGEREMNIARSCQLHFEEVFLHCLRRLHALVPERRIAYAGGCALNGVANARMLRESPFRESWIQCAASDDGTCIGAAFWCWHHVLGQSRRFVMEHAYWGPQHSEAAMASAAGSCGLPQIKCESDAELVDLVSEIVRKGQVVGWYQGRSEWGPRALGNRSIIASPLVPNMKELINTKIKRRESFRPFAPSVLRERVADFFEQDIPSPFMMHVVKLREEWRERLPAITHVDGTGRLQTVTRDQNRLYYDLIKRFDEKTGVGLILNTSFNENEPIVDTPAQAADCFLRNDIDVLVLGRFVVAKDPSHLRKMTEAQHAAS